MNWSRYCDFEYLEKPAGTRLGIMGIVHRASAEWQNFFRKLTSLEWYFANAKQSRLLDWHQVLGQEKVSRHATVSVLSYLITVRRRLMAGTTIGMRGMHVKLSG